MNRSTLLNFIVLLTLPLMASANYDIIHTAFFEQATSEISVKNYWKYLKEDAANPKEVHNAWGQGMALNYHSGYLADVIGIDVDYYSAAKLGASDYFNTRGVLYNHGSGNSKHNAAGYSKFGQRMIKLKGALGNTELNARVGWQMLRNEGVISTSNRLSPTTYRGWSGGIKRQGFSLKGAYVERSIDRNSPDSLRLQTNDGHYINHLASTEIGYQDAKFSGQLAYGEAHHYLRRQIAHIRYQATDQLTLGSQIYTTQAQAAYKAMALGKRHFDRHANHYAIDAKWQEPRWSIKLGIGHTCAPKGKGELGFYPRHLSKHSRGTFASMAYAGEDYMRDGETMLATQLEYRLSADLSAGLMGNYGQFDYQGTTVRTGEINAFTRWKPSQAGLKNFSLFAMFGQGWSYKNRNKTPLLTEGYYHTSHSLSAEFIAEYRFKLL